MPGPSQRADDLSGTDLSGTDRSGPALAGTQLAHPSSPDTWDADDESPPATDGSPLSGRQESESRRRRSTGTSAPATVRRQCALGAVALASTVVGLLAFLIAATITRLPVGYTAFRFDTTWFYRIAEHGYLHRQPSGPTDYGGLRVAFFPGLPVAERAVHAVVGGGPALTTVMVGAIGLVVSCLVLWSLVARDWDEGAAWRSVVLLAFFPGAYVFSMAYSEALAIPLAIATLWALRRRWFLVAGIAAALAGTMRLDSVVLVVVCAVAAGRHLLEKDRSTRSVVTAVASPFVAAAGLLGYMIYLKSATGGFLTFSTAERLGWGDHLSLWAPFHQLRLLAEHGVHSTPVVIMNGTGVIAVVIALVLVIAVSMPLEYKVFAIGVLGTWLVTTDHGAWVRYVEFAFPVIVAVAVKVPEKILLPMIGVCAATLGVLIVLFASATPFFP